MPRALGSPQQAVIPPGQKYIRAVGLLNSDFGFRYFFSSVALMIFDSKSSCIILFFLSRETTTEKMSLMHILVLHFHISVAAHHLRAAVSDVSVTSGEGLLASHNICCRRSAGSV